MVPLHGLKVIPSVHSSKLRFKIFSIAGFRKFLFVCLENIPTEVYYNVRWKYRVCSFRNRRLLQGIRDEACVLVFLVEGRSSLSFLPLQVLL